MIYQYDQIEVLINGSGVLAESAVLNTNNALEGIYCLGNKTIVNQNHNGPLKSTLNLNYLLEVNNEKSFSYISYLRTGFSNFSYDALTISVAGVTGTYNLDSYSINAAPNEPIMAKATYSSYYELTGNIQTKTSSTNYNLTNSSGVGHAYSLILFFILDSSSPANTPTYDFSYDFRANWQPIYTLGQKYPNQIALNGCSENINITKDYYTNLGLSGVTLNEYLKNPMDGEPGPPLYDVNVIGLSFIETFNQEPNLILDISGAKVNSIELGANINGVVNTEIKASNYF